MTKLSELEAILFVAGEAGIGSEELSYLLNVDKQDLAELILALEKNTKQLLIQRYTFLKQKTISS